MESEPEREITDTKTWTSYQSNRAFGSDESISAGISAKDSGTTTKISAGQKFANPDQPGHIEARNDIDKEIQNAYENNVGRATQKVTINAIKEVKAQNDTQLANITNTKNGHEKNLTGVVSAFKGIKGFDAFVSSVKVQQEMIAREKRTRQEIASTFGKLETQLNDSNNVKDNDLGQPPTIWLFHSKTGINWAKTDKTVGRTLMTAKEQGAIKNLPAIAINALTAARGSFYTKAIQSNYQSANSKDKFKALPWANAGLWKAEAKRDEGTAPNPEWESWDATRKTKQDTLDGIKPEGKLDALNNQKDILQGKKTDLRKFRDELRDARAEREEKTTKRKRPPVGGYYTSKGSAAAKGPAKGKGKGKGKGKKSSKKDKKDESLFFKDNRDLIGENKMAKLKDLLSEVFDERPQIDKHKVIKGVSEYGNVGKSLYGTNIVEIAKKLSSIAESAHSHILSETDEWFDKVSVNRNMKSLKSSVKEFKKAALESHALNQRLTALYEDIGHVLNRYYEIKEEVDDIDDEEAAMDYEDLPDKDIDNDGDEDDSDEYLHHKLGNVAKRTESNKPRMGGIVNPTVIGGSTKRN